MTLSERGTKPQNTIAKVSSNRQNRHNCPQTQLPTPSTDCKKSGYAAVTIRTARECEGLATGGERLSKMQFKSSSSSCLLLLSKISINSWRTSEQGSNYRHCPKFVGFENPHPYAVGNGEKGRNWERSLKPHLCCLDWTGMSAVHLCLCVCRFFWEFVGWCAHTSIEFRLRTHVP